MRNSRKRAPKALWSLAGRLSIILLLTSGLPVLAQEGDGGDGADEIGGTEPTFQDLMAREQALQADRPFVAPEDRFRVLLPFPLAGEPAVEETQVSFALDLGTGAPVNCFAQLDSLDPATAAAAVGMSSLPVGTEGSPILAREIHAIDIHNVDHEIVVATDWLYNVQQGEEQLTGMFKVRAASLGLGGLLCLHDEVGYKDTLDRIVDRMVRSWVGGGDDVVTPFFYELTVTRVNGLPLSADQTTISIDEEGDYVIRSRTSDLTPHDASTLSGEETYAIDFAFPSGELINSIEIKSDSSQHVEQLNLNAVDDTTWSVSGTFQSKPLEHTIEHGALSSELLERKKIQRFFATAKSGDKMTEGVWLPDADPTIITEADLVYVERRGNLHLTKIVLGELELDAEIDEAGSVVRASADVPGAKVELERVYLSGVFPEVPLDE